MKVIILSILVGIVLGGPVENVEKTSKSPGESTSSFHLMHALTIDRVTVVSHQDTTGILFIADRVMTNVHFSANDYKNATLTAGTNRNITLTGNNYQDIHIEAKTISIDIHLNGTRMTNTTVLASFLQNVQLHGTGFQDTHIKGASLLSHVSLKGNETLNSTRLEGSTIENVTIAGENIDDTRVTGVDVKVLDLNATNRISNCFLTGNTIHNVTLNSSAYDYLTIFGDKVQNITIGSSDKSNFTKIQLDGKERLDNITIDGSRAKTMKNVSINGIVVEQKDPFSLKCVTKYGQFEGTADNAPSSCDAGRCNATCVSQNWTVATCYGHTCCCLNIHSNSSTQMTFSWFICILMLTAFYFRRDFA